MNAEVQGQNGGHMGALPAGMRARASWQPLAMHAVASLLSGVLSHHALFVERGVRLSAWHEQFTRRLQPWSGWVSPALEPQMGEGPAAGQTLTTSAPGFTSTEQWLPATLIAGPMPVTSAVRGDASAPTPGAASPPAEPAAVPLHPATGAQQPRPAMTLSRPAMRLAVLGSSAASIDTMPGRAPGLALSGSQLPVAAQSAPEVGQFLASDLPVAASRHPLWRLLPTTPEPVLEPRLVTSVRPTPRQEVRGGFPVPPPALPAPERTSAAPITSPLRQWVLIDDAPSAPMPAQPVSMPTAQGAIEQLIEQTVLPVALPGLELRLVRHEQQASPMHRSAHPAEDGQSTMPVSTPPASVAAAPPPLDINAIAEKVFTTLMCRQRLERERRGLY